MYLQEINFFNHLKIHGIKVYIYMYILIFGLGCVSTNLMDL